MPATGIIVKKFIAKASAANNPEKRIFRPSFMIRSEEIPFAKKRYMK